MRVNWLSAWKSKLSMTANRPAQLRKSRDVSPRSTESLETRCLLSATAGIDYHDDGSVHGLDGGGNEWNALPAATFEATTAATARARAARQTDFVITVRKPNSAHNALTERPLNEKRTYNNLS
jgi:hypothetical protein